MCIGYAFRPHLSSGLPWADEPSPGNLRLSAIMILTYFSLLIPAFSLPFCPRPLTLSLHPTTERSPTTYLTIYPKLRLYV